MKHSWFRALIRRRIFILVLLAIQIYFFVHLISASSKAYTALNTLLKLFSIFAVLHVISDKNKGSYKTFWVFIILSFPLFGGLLYVLFKCQSSTRQVSKTIEYTNIKAAALFPLPGTAYYTAKALLNTAFPQVKYLSNHVGFPVYDNSEVFYFSPGEAMYEDLLPELEKAERFIFIESFIIQEGTMWNSILEILKKKAQEGILVRILYDDLGCFLTLPSDYPKQLKSFGIHCEKFNKFRPILTSMQNHRDHRKIISIDGVTAFTGGINLADEYINEKEKCGHWKDSAVKISGKAAWSLTLMFLQMWELCSGIDEDYNYFYPWKDSVCNVHAEGLVQPYADSPFDRENVGEHVYLQIINHAQKYIYINTPYLILDDSVLSALILASKRGVNVTIVTPHKWDKFWVHMTTRSYYKELIDAGINIYEYSNGFMHAKSFVSDDMVAVIGTTNLDYRSLYLHFECGTILWATNTINEMKEDFINTLKKCEKINKKNCKENMFIRTLQRLLRLIAPLM